MFADPMHAARLALLEGALLALLREAADDASHDDPDGISVRLDNDGLSIEYTRGGLPVAGEGL